MEPRALLEHAPPRHAKASEVDPRAYTLSYIDFMRNNPTVFHVVQSYAIRLQNRGFEELSERGSWADHVREGGRYFVRRNGSSLIAFVVGNDYAVGNGAAIVAGHIDAITVKLKPISKLENRTGFTRLGVAPYADGLNSTWWDRDLGIGGRILHKDPKSGTVKTEVFDLGWPIARIPTLAPHFGAISLGPFNKETQMVPIIGVDNSDLDGEDAAGQDVLGESDKSGLRASGFASTQPEKLLRRVEEKLCISRENIVGWELELFDTQPAQLGGIDRDFIFAGRIDDKLCSFAALEALLASCPESGEDKSGIIKVAAVFDDEEIGSFLRQGARSNFLSDVLERTTEALADLNGAHYGPDLKSRTYANSFLVSADVIHAVNPNFLNAYLEHHAPRLNYGVAISADPNGHMTTDAVSTALLGRVAERSGCRLQVFQIRNDSRSGGTVGPMLSSHTGIRAIDVGIPQLSMHSIRATTGSLDPGLGVKTFLGFYDHYEAVDEEFSNT